MKRRTFLMTDTKFKDIMQKYTCSAKKKSKYFLKNAIGLYFAIKRMDVLTFCLHYTDFFTAVE